MVSIKANPHRTKTSGLASLPSDFIGERLRLAREENEMTQQEATDKFGVALSTLLAIEKGQSRPSFDNVLKLSELYKTTLGLLFNRDAVHVDFLPRFRKLPSAADKSAVEAVRIMSQLAKAEVELENLLGIKRARNYPPERPILSGNVGEQALHDAQELRQHLGIGTAPITDIVSLLEMEMGARVYVRRVDSHIAGLFAYAEEVGPCILLNANHPPETRALSAAHACGHLVSARSKPAIHHVDEVMSSREQLYADAFARTFLVPTRTLKIRFQGMTSCTGSISRQLVVVFAHSFGVSNEILLRRLEELGLIKEGTWDWFQSSGGITAQQIKSVLGDIALKVAKIADADHPTTLRLSLLAAEAHRRDFLTEGQLAELLRLDRITMRNIIYDIDMDEEWVDGELHFT